MECLNRLETHGGGGGGGVLMVTQVLRVKESPLNSNIARVIIHPNNLHE